VIIGAVAKGFPSADVIKRCLRHPDDMCEWTAKAVTYSEELRVALRAQGWHKDADALEIIGESHQAWTIPGFTSEERSRGIARLGRMVRQLFNQQLWDVETMMKMHHPCGLTRDLLLDWACNGDAHAQLVEIPGVREILCELALGTDDLETYFGELVRRAGWKPTYEIAIAIMQTIESLMQQKRDANSLLNLPASTKKRYSINTVSAKKLAKWNNGMLVGSAPAAVEARQAMIDHVITQAQRQVEPSSNTARDLRLGKIKQIF
jgi:hypothetical protein